MIEFANISIAPSSKHPPHVRRCGNCVHRSCMRCSKNRNNIVGCTCICSRLQRGRLPFSQSRWWSRWMWTWSWFWCRRRGLNFPFPFPFNVCFHVYIFCFIIFVFIFIFSLVVNFDFIVVIIVTIIFGNRRRRDCASLAKSEQRYTYHPYYLPDSDCRPLHPWGLLSLRPQIRRLVVHLCSLRLCIN